MFYIRFWLRGVHVLCYVRVLLWLIFVNQMWQIPLHFSLNGIKQVWNQKSRKWIHVILFLNINIKGLFCCQWQRITTINNNPVDTEIMTMMKSTFIEQNDWNSCKYPMNKRHHSSDKQTRQNRGLKEYLQSLQQIHLTSIIGTRENPTHRNCVWVIVANYHW